MFHRAGHRVVMAECLPTHLSRHSRSVSKNYLVPWPTKNPNEYQDEIASIIEAENVDLLVPTCEEIYFHSQFRDLLPDDCCWLISEWTQLHALHSKWEFVNLASQHELAVPKTMLLTSRRDLEDALEQEIWQVFKPVYSRFASEAIVCPQSNDELDEVYPGEDSPWVAQQFIKGQQVSTFGLAREGKLLAHATYPMNFTTGIGPTYAYEAMQHSGVLKWVQDFIWDLNFSGQIAFDFIIEEDGSVVAIECNPRATSGLHLFRNRTDLVHAYLHGETPTGELLAPDSRPAHHGLPLLLWGLGFVRSWSELKRWAAMLFRGRDVLFCWRDPLPICMLAWNLYPIFKRKREYGVTIDQACTMDIEWNGVIESTEWSDDSPSLPKEQIQN